MTLNSWVAPSNIRLPDFIICGAMKCGTTSMHAILAQHPKVYMPEREVNFFHIDNISFYPDSNRMIGDGWVLEEFEKNPSAYWDWYASLFRDAQPGQLIGEDSTLYLPSEVAVERIVQQKQDIKLIVMLRQPTSRTQSEYWHQLRFGLASHTFKDTLNFIPSTIIQKSLYLDQLKRMYSLVPKENLKVVIFEEFLKDKHKVLAEVCEYIGLDFNLLSEEAINAHSNQGMTPRIVNMSILTNRIFGDFSDVAESWYPLVEERNIADRIRIKSAKIFRRSLRFTTYMKGKTPKMDASTRKYLDNFFKRELEGINELLDKDVFSIWFKD